MNPSLNSKQQAFGCCSEQKRYLRICIRFGRVPPCCITSVRITFAVNSVKRLNSALKSRCGIIHVRQISCAARCGHQFSMRSSSAEGFSIHIDSDWNRRASLQSAGCIDPIKISPWPLKNQTYDIPSGHSSCRAACGPCLQMTQARTAGADIRPIHNDLFRKAIFPLCIPHKTKTNWPDLVRSGQDSNLQSIDGIQKRNCASLGSSRIPKSSSDLRNQPDSEKRAVSALTYASVKPRAPQ